MVSLNKPAYGDPCNGCGLCCLAEPCPIAKEILGQSEGACKALVFDDGRYWCDLVRGNAHLYVNSLAGKDWAGNIYGKMLLKSGGWSGICDSD